MARYKPRGKKLRLAKRLRQTKWAPVWIVPKMHRGLKRIHPSRFTRIKRSWRKSRTRA
ncbi:MAG TPA: 50S ribosomal protein L39e [Candidatus Nanoarchaeia archaeon]|nr:50S ribosomal protein L39e [Candidatus Nanoarchaeia archaeon]